MIYAVIRKASDFRLNRRIYHERYYFTLAYVIQYAGGRKGGFEGISSFILTKRARSPTVLELHDTLQRPPFNRDL